MLGTSLCSVLVVCILDLFFFTLVSEPGLGGTTGVTQ